MINNSDFKCKKYELTYSKKADLVDQIKFIKLKMPQKIGKKMFKKCVMCNKEIGLTKNMYKHMKICCRHKCDLPSNPASAHASTPAPDSAPAVIQAK